MQQRFPFISDGAFAARAPFRFAGVAFYPRDPFPGGRVQNVDTRRLRQLWLSRLIECVGPAAAPAPAPASVETATATETETSVVLELGEGVSASTEVIEHDVVTKKLDVVVWAAELNSEPRRGAGEVAETTGDGLPPDGSATSADLTGA